MRTGMVFLGVVHWTLIIIPTPTKWSRLTEEKGEIATTIDSWKYKSGFVSIQVSCASWEGGVRDSHSPLANMKGRRNPNPARGPVGSVNECFAADKQNICNKKFFFIFPPSVESVFYATRPFIRCCVLFACFIFKVMSCGAFVVLMSCFYTSVCENVHQPPEMRA